MSGKRYLLDTNAIVSLLQGNQALATTLNQADWVGISIISELEFLSFPALSLADEHLFQNFKQRIDVVGLTTQDQNLVGLCLQLRKAKTLKLPDAIVAASAIAQSAILVTEDSDFSKLPGLQIVKP